MKYIDTYIPELKIIEPTVSGDHRGFFMETFRVDKFTSNSSEKTFFKTTTVNLAMKYYAVYITSLKMLKGN